METAILNDASLKTPAFILDEAALQANLERFAKIRSESGCKVLYSIKALPLQYLIELMKNRVDGFSVSSLFEAQLANELLESEETELHLTSPGLRAEEMPQIGRQVSHLSFNSLTQMEHFHELTENCSIGLRINPKISCLNDRRYDPCRGHSKLGIDINVLEQFNLPSYVQGLHFHNSFGGLDFNCLQRTLDRLWPFLEKHYQQIKWLNLGGGYMYAQIDQLQPFFALLNRLQQELGFQVYIEPGKSFVQGAGYLAATVIDRFVSDGKIVAVLDSSVNHHPEVFEYQTPATLWGRETGGYSVIFAGSTCLAGDIFGEFQLAEVPEIGERVVFSDVAAYSLVKANRFNGYNLPNVYSRQNEQLRLLKQYDYQDYLRLWRLDEHE